MGEIVKFGKYEWYVIDTNLDGCTLLCKDIIENRKYHTKMEDITWEECTLRSYLNNDFYNSFSEAEKAQIIKTKCVNKDNADYKTKGENDTEDYVYLLSIDEATALLPEMRNCGSWWWLRSPGAIQSRAAAVRSDDYVDTSGSRVDYEYGVRPAMTIKFD